MIQFFCVMSVIQFYKLRLLVIQILYLKLKCSYPHCFLWSKSKIFFDQEKNILKIKTFYLFWLFMSLFEKEKVVLMFWSIKFSILLIIMNQLQTMQSALQDAHNWMSVRLAVGAALIVGSAIFYFAYWFAMLRREDKKAYIYMN